jgi:DNA-binding transcriptional LysR family regulator
VVQHYPRLVTEDLCILKESALGGCGIADLPPQFCQEDLNAGRLVQILPDWSLPLMRLYAVYPSRRGLTLAARTLIDYLSSHFHPWIDAALNGSLQLRSANFHGVGPPLNAGRPSLVS